MLASTLVTNEVKNAAGTEEEFERFNNPERGAEYIRINESPAYPHRLKVNHTESGDGVTARRRSVIRFDKTVAGQVDTTKTMRCSAYIVLDLPKGQLTSNALPNDVMANLISFCASLGASTTILYDGTGNGTKTLVLGTV